MKQNKNIKKEKDNYLKFTFLFPVISSVIDAIIMAAAIYYSGQQSVANVAFARLVMQTATVLLALSPTFLLINAFLSHKHSKKYTTGSAFYVKTPMMFSLIVWGVQVLYMASFTGA